MNEEFLIKQVRKKDRKAEKQLYDRYCKQMFRLCYRYINQMDESQDVLLEAFFKVFSKIDTFEYRGEGSLEKWLKTIVINEALMYLRKIKKMELVRLENQHLQVQYSEEPDCTNDAERIFEMVQTLPMGYRTVFNLYAIDGFSHQEIAEKLGISVGTSKSQLSRARQILQEQISEERKNERKLG